MVGVTHISVSACKLMIKKQKVKSILGLCKNLDGTLQNSLREVKLKIMNQTECSKYAFPNPEQKYCSGESNLLQDTCQVRILKSLYVKMSFKIEIKLFKIIKGDSGGGMYCQMSDLKWYVGG